MPVIQLLQCYFKKDIFLNSYRKITVARCLHEESRSYYSILSVKLIFFSWIDSWYCSWTSSLLLILSEVYNMSIKLQNKFNLSYKPMQRWNSVSISIGKVFCAFPFLAFFIKDRDLPCETLISATWFSGFMHEVDEEKLQGALAYWWKFSTDDRDSAFMQRLAILLTVQIPKDIMYTAVFGVIPIVKSLPSICPDRRFSLSLFLYYR